MARAYTFVERDGIRLACRDFGGQGPTVLLLHGLAGHAGEWEETAVWLSERCRLWRSISAVTARASAGPRTYHERPTSRTRCL